jgi:hypothetical protein
VGQPTSVPAQGFETEEEVRTGVAVEPPSRLELATSVIDIAAEGLEELVKAGLSTGSSLLKRVLGSLPKP